MRYVEASDNYGSRLFGGKQRLANHRASISFRNRSVPISASGLYSLRNGIPIHGALPVVRLIRHVTAERCVVTEQNVLHDRFSRPDGLEEIPEMRPQIIIVVPPITYALRGRLISRFGIVLVVPALEVGVLQAARKSVAVIAGSQVNPGLRDVAEAKL